LSYELNFVDNTAIGVRLPYLILILILVLNGPGQAAAVDPAVPEHAVILMYHHVSEDTPASTSVSPEVFARHLSFLADHGFRVRPLPEIVAALRNEVSLPDSVVAITFDDGYSSVYETAYPLLSERGWPFTVFVSSEAIDTRQGPVTTWPQLREMADHGATIASHGRHHQHLQRLRDGESREEWARRIQGELEHSLRRIAQETGQEHNFLAYPFGENDARLRGLVAAMGWVAFGQQSGAVGALSDTTCLPRFPMAAGFADLEEFGVKVASLPLPVAEWQAEDLIVRFSEESVILGADPPVLKVRLKAQCPGLAAYASGQGKALITPSEQKPGWLEVRAREGVPPGRSRYNLTAPFGGSGRWYWYSHTWIVGEAHDD
jgi:biofilm PGA synthesis lipoprotein PgaB